MSTNRMVKNLRYSSDRSVAAGQTLGTMAYVIGGSFGQAATVLPGFAIARGLLSMVNGVFILLGDKTWYTQNEKRARGLFQILSSTYLLEGGIEEGAKVFFDTDISLGLPGSLLWRMAVHSITEFVLAWDELFAFYLLSEEQRILSTDCADRKRNILFSLFATGLTATGWFMLAMTQNMTEPVGFACLAVAGVSYTCKYAPRAFDFFAVYVLNTVLSDTSHSVHVSRFAGSAEQLSC
jgi:hypothetical protein